MADQAGLSAESVAVEYTCSCEGCRVCTGHEYGCTCDIDWDRARDDLTYRAPGRFGPPARTDGSITERTDG